MTTIVVSLQIKLCQAHNEVLEEIHRLDDAFSKLGSENSVTK